jgi:hypothetical protein
MHGRVQLNTNLILSVERKRLRFTVPDETTSPRPLLKPLLQTMGIQLNRTSVSCIQSQHDEGLSTLPLK